jgi:hypothetical protein
MLNESINEPPGNAPELKRVTLTKRKSPEDYWDGYRAGLKAARDGIDASLNRFDDMLMAVKKANQNENGGDRGKEA